MYQWWRGSRGCARCARHRERICLTDLAHEGHFSHDNVFHTVLGLHRIRTSIYDASLDLLRPCRDHRATWVSGRATSENGGR